MPADRPPHSTAARAVERQADHLHRTAVRDLGQAGRTLTAEAGWLRLNRRNAAKAAGEMANIISLLVQAQRDLGILAGLDQAAELYNDNPAPGQE
jgi:hypothetical protein